MTRNELKLLISEDNEDVANLYETVLKSRGHHVTITSNAKDCLEKYNSELETDGNNSKPFDLVLLDYRMPGMSGIGVCKKILSLVPNQRIIFSSAYVEELERALGNIKDKFDIYPKFSTIEKFIDIVENRS